MILFWITNTTKFVTITEHRKCERHFVANDNDKMLRHVIWCGPDMRFCWIASKLLKLNTAHQLAWSKLCFSGNLVQQGSNAARIFRLTIDFSISSKRLLFTSWVSMAQLYIHSGLPIFEKTVIEMTTFVACRGSLFMTCGSIYSRKIEKNWIKSLQK